MSLKLDNISFKVRGESWISPTTMELAAGSLNVLLGPTLSGKTTLMRLMAGLDAPTTGKIIFNGEDVTGIPVRRRNVAMVYQQFINYPSVSVYENIASPLRVKGMCKDEIETRVLRAAKLLKLETYLKRLPLELSGGQQQRTAEAVISTISKGRGKLRPFPHPCSEEEKCRPSYWPSTRAPQARAPSFSTTS